MGDDLKQIAHRRELELRRELYGDTEPESAPEPRFRRIVKLEENPEIREIQRRTRRAQR